MAMNDPVGDMLTRIRNAQMRRKSKVSTPGSRLRAHVLDVREAFARDVVLPSLKAGALEDSRYPMARALSRPLIARSLAEIAAIEKANVRILESGKRSATTIVVAEISGGQLRCYHVGDSELIVCGQRGRIKQRIIPHSPTGFAVEAGLLDEQEAVQHEQRHIIFNVIGAPDMRVDVSTAIALAPFDTVLLTSDGVLDNLYVDEIVEIIRMGPLALAADRLLQATRARMEKQKGTEPSKPDDVTIVLYRRHRQGRI